MQSNALDSYVTHGENDYTIQLQPRLSDVVCGTNIGYSISQGWGRQTQSHDEKSNAQEQIQVQGPLNFLRVSRERETHPGRQY